MKPERVYPIQKYWEIRYEYDRGFGRDMETQTGKAERQVAGEKPVTSVLSKNTVDVGNRPARRKSGYSESIRTKSDLPEGKARIYR